MRVRASAATDARVTRGCHESERRVHERACVYSSAQSKHFPRLPLNNSTMPNTYVPGISPDIVLLAASRVLKHGRRLLDVLFRS